VRIESQSIDFKVDIENSWLKCDDIMCIYLYIVLDKGIGFVACGKHSGVSEKIAQLLFDQVKLHTSESIIKQVVVIAMDILSQYIFCFSLFSLCYNIFIYK